jgi:hypothetical protein
MISAKRKVLLLLLLLLLCSLGILFLNGVKRSRFVIGNPIPIKVTPRINSSASGCGTMIAPDGSLWRWGVLSEYYMVPFSRISSEVPVQIGKDRDWVTLATGSGFLIGLSKTAAFGLLGRILMCSDNQAEPTEPTLLKLMLIMIG